MNKLTHNLAVKTAAVFLFVICMILFIVGTGSIIYLADRHFYEGSPESAREEVFKSISRKYADDVFYLYYNSHLYEPGFLQEVQEKYSADNTNFFFILEDEKGETLFSNYTGQDTQYSYTFYFEEGGYWYDNAEGSSVYAEKTSYKMKCYVNKSLHADDSYSNAESWITFGYSMRYAVIFITILSFMASVILFVFLMCSAGRRRGIEGIIPNGIDRIPFDILLTVLFILAYIELVLMNEALYLTFNGNTIIGILLAAFVLITGIPLFLMACMSFATRYKLGGWWKNTIVYRFLYFIYRIARRLVLGTVYLLKHISLIWKTVLVLFILSTVEFIAIISNLHNGGILLLLWLLEKLVLVPVVLFIAINLNKLHTAGERIARGDLDYRIDTGKLFWDFKKQGENLNDISMGVSKAVEERMKSERFKTELITNVSHDIKTPLTSIINYVDLLKREDVEEGKIKEYIHVLDRQSSRLKKLIEDLVEASKASTGNLPVNSTRTEVGVLLTQTVGEYEERLKESKLELILNQSEEEIFIMADGRLLWRVFDNLMDNICKYSLPGSRTYLSLERQDGNAVITFRNISKHALNITSEELLERFRRGDSSRSTEGSGLGLSIAKSLVELQNGILDLIIDGDLFKVVLTFKTVE